jgi:very-short-patch-repair endonuclease
MGFAVGEPFIGKEAVATGQLTPHLLRTRFVAIYPGVYVAKDAVINPVTRAEACFLWSRRRGVVAGFSAAALHGAKWISAARPGEIIHGNRHPPSRVRTWADGIAEDEIEEICGIRVTTPPRTALDIACRYRVDEAVAAIDSLARATGLKPPDVELLAQRYAGRRGINRARTTLDLIDSGAESPRETWLRLVLTRAGMPRPQTQIAVHDKFGQLIACLDMGWQDIMVAVEYEGDHHRTDRRQFNKDIRRTEILAGLGWIVVRVTSEDCEADIIRRVGAARASRM